MAASTIIAILGLLWTMFQSLLLFFQIWAFFDGLWMGQRAEPVTLLKFAGNGITITILAVLLLPYLKPVIVWSIKAICAAFNLQFVPVAAIEAGLNVASDMVKVGTGAAAAVGKKVIGSVGETVAPAGPIHVVIDNLPQLLAAVAQPAAPVADSTPAPAPAAPSATAGAK